MARKQFDMSLYLVTDTDLARDRDLEWIVQEAVKGGVTMVQIREKEASTRDFVEIARRIKLALQGSGVAVVVNDRVDVALAAGLDGVHIGQSDMSYEDARRLLGEESIIGLSVETQEQVAAANELNVDYIGISPIYATPTKQDTYQPFGLDGCRAAVAQSRHRAVAIGGMNATTIAEVVRCGVEGVAVVSAIVAAEDPRASAAALYNIIKGESNEIL